MMIAALIGALAGAWLQLQQGALWMPWLYAALALAGAAGVAGGWVLQRRCGAPAAAVAGHLLLAGAAVALLFGLTGGRAAWHAAQALPAHLEGQDLMLEGWVASLPRRRELGVQFEFVVETAHRQGQPVVVPERVLLSWGTGFVPVGDAVAATQGRAPAAALPVIEPGQRWRLPVRLGRPHGQANPHGFDFELWLWQQGLHATGYVRTGRQAPAPQWLASTWWHPVDQARMVVRDAILDRVDDGRAAGVLAALVVGDQASIDAVDWEVFRITGVAHLVSVSGLHVTMFAWLAVAVLGGLWRRAAGVWPGLLWRWPAPTAGAVGGVALAALYAVFSGGGVPAQRTVLMLAVVVALRLGARRWPWPVTWLLVMNAVVLLDPWALLQAGFWLSFVAVAVLFATSLPGAGSAGVRQQARAMLRQQAVVTVALAPLTLLFFGQFSLASLLANLLAIPWVTLVVLPLAMLGVLLPVLWDVAAWGVQALGLWLGWLAAWPWAAVERPALPPLLAWAAILGGVLLVWRLPWSVRAWGLLLLWPALVFTPQRPPQGGFEVLVPDVGQGGAVLVRTAAHTLLYDTGPVYGPRSDAGHRVLLPLLRSLGDRPDAVVVSHIDSDHAGGMQAIAGRFSRVQWWASFDPFDKGVAVPFTRCEAGQRWVWDGVPFEVLHPRAEDYRPGADSNALSCVLRIGSGEHTALLTGDITVQEENRLALQDPGLRTALLLSAHHGSKTSSGPVWLNTVRPRWIVVQSGHRNRYNHPAPTVTRRYDARGIPWVNSPTCGAATWRSWVPDALACHRETHRRYWQHSSEDRGPGLAR